MTLMIRLILRYAVITSIVDGYCRTDDARSVDTRATAMQRYEITRYVNIA